MRFASRAGSVAAILLTGVLMLSLAASSTHAQDRPAEVSGRVVSSRDNQPLALVQVELAGTAFSTVTDADGNLRIAAVPAGTYVLQATSVGYRVIRQDFAVAAGEAKRFEV